MKRLAISDWRFRIAGKRALWSAMAGMACLLSAASASAGSVRVVTWDLEPTMAAGTNGTSTNYQRDLIREAAETLKKLKPDVILLQGVSDWPSCNELVKALKPGKYNVAAWSSFRDVDTKKLSRQQTAILSKGRAYISWSADWKNENAAAMPGGFAFAAVKIGGHNAGFFSVQMGANTLAGGDGSAEARQLLAQMDALKNWRTNRVQSLIVAGVLNITGDTAVDEKPLRSLQGAGLADTFGSAPLAQRITLPSNSHHPEAAADYILARGATPVATPEIVPAGLTEHYPVTCDLDLENAPEPPPLTAPVAQVTPATPATPVTQATQTTSAELPASKPDAGTNATSGTAGAPVAIATTDESRTWRIAGIVAGGVLLLLIFWRLAKGRRAEPATTALVAVKSSEPLRITTPAGPEPIVIAPQTADTTGSTAEHPPLVHIDVTDTGDGASWRQRAEDAERRADRAKALARHGLMTHLSEWLKGKVVQRLALDRAHLLEVQRTATLKMRVVDERLAKIEGQLQEHRRAYEKRIEELEKELAEAREENRELIRAKIALVKAEMEKEQAEAERRAKEQGS